MEEKKRIAFLDETRGLLVVLMVFFHAFYTGGYLFGWHFPRSLYLFFSPSEIYFAGLFIVICGICCHLSHSNLKRGLVLAGVALGMSLVLWLFMPDNAIWFGILHFLAFGILFYALLEKPLSRIPTWIGFSLCVLFTILTFHVPFDNGYYFGISGLFEWHFPSSLLNATYLFPLGLGFIDSADYFPIIPCIFVFLAGTFLGRFFKEEKHPKWMNPVRVKPLGFIGRHALIIYIVHQPILYGIFWIIEFFTTC